MIHSHASIGLMLGDKSVGTWLWNEIIRLVTNYALDELGLISLNAGCYSDNIASYKSFIKAGWECTGSIKSTG